MWVLLLLACLSEPPADSGSDSTRTTDSAPTETGDTETGTTPTTDTAHTEAGCPVSPTVKGVRLVAEATGWGSSYYSDSFRVQVLASDTEIDAAITSLASDTSLKQELVLDPAPDWDRELVVLATFGSGSLGLPFGLAAATAPDGGPASLSWCVSFDITLADHPSTEVDLVAYPREWGAEVEATLTVIE